MRVTIDGTTVRRDVGAWAPAVHALLRHFEATGYDGAPGVLGVDDDGREVLSFVEGEPAWPPPCPPDDDVVFELGALLRRMHDAQAGFDAAGLEWQRMVGMPEKGEVVCHNDLHPNNVVFRDGRPVALIDWDLAAPAPRLFDLASAAQYWAPLGSDEWCAERGLPSGRRAERLALLCDGYGLSPGDRRGLLDAVERIETIALDTFRSWGRDLRLPQWADEWDAGNANKVAASQRWLREHRAALEPALL